jgi:hypothetical protein
MVKECKKLFGSFLCSKNVTKVMFFCGADIVAVLLTELFVKKELLSQLCQFFPQQAVLPLIHK